MAKITEILSGLIRNGYVENNPNIPLTDINDSLRPLNYVAMYYPGRKYIVLFDTQPSKKIIRPWTEITSEKARLVIEAIAMSKPYSNDIIPLLEQTGWVYNIDGKHKLTPRAYVQFGEFILSLGEDYKKCPLCGIVSYKREVHEECEREVKEGYENRKNEQREKNRSKRNTYM